MKVLKILSAVILFFLGINGTAGGVLLMIDPSGGLLQMPASLLRGAVFKDFLIPGIVLTLFIGISGIIIGIVTLKDAATAPQLILIQGIVVCIWMSVEICLIREFSFLQPFIAGLGLMLIALGAGMLKLKKSRVF